jgi:hypothetical protein
MVLRKAKSLENSNSKAAIKSSVGAVDKSSSKDAIATSTGGKKGAKISTSSGSSSSVGSDSRSKSKSFKIDTTGWLEKLFTGIYGDNYTPSESMKPWLVILCTLMHTYIYFIPTHMLFRARLRWAGKAPAALGEIVSGIHASICISTYAMYCNERHVYSHTYIYMYMYVSDWGYPLSQALLRPVCCVRSAPLT